MSNVEKYLDEGGIHDLKYLQNLGRQYSGLISKTSKDLKWDIDNTYAFIIGLLEDVNAHSVVPEVTRILLKDLNR